MDAHVLDGRYLRAVRHVRSHLRYKYLEHSKNINFMPCAKKHLHVNEYRFYHSHQSNLFRTSLALRHTAVHSLLHGCVWSIAAQVKWLPAHRAVRRCFTKELIQALTAKSATEQTNRLRLMQQLFVICIAQNNQLRIVYPSLNITII